MRYKHKFYIVNKLMNDEINELATCSCEMTANYLADYFRSVYTENCNGIEIVYKYGRKETVIVGATYGN
ncbi:hypothetical protein [Vagococcus fluvialis]|uniref:hypothetical protein n=1 Tax=Vagococcus fluvialis TaxID=2738 RepID=UPI001D09E765|nr:hypothetical protein [Vagococcus fluvialis]UDM72775.1 hypothetical protein K5L00_14570 [Vagococcus fluvialis]UDM78331.1 hypothetical protein K5K98_14775 [Vagococcus fluvialis]UDM84050.1 hypothetical protein K5K96_14595 [Vagococcus fluvialis]